MGVVSERWWEAENRSRWCSTEKVNYSRPFAKRLREKDVVVPFTGPEVSYKFLSVSGTDKMNLYIVREINAMY